MKKHIDTGPSFYKVDSSGALLDSLGLVGPGYTLDANIPADRERIVNGWQWFESEAEARAAYGLPESDPEPEPDGDNPQDPQ